MERPSWPLYLVSLVAVLSPMFLMASKVDADEFAKSGLGIATVAAVVAICKGFGFIAKHGKALNDE